MATSTAATAYIGARIRAARQEANLTQAELAKSAGLSRAQVLNFELGNREPLLSTFAALVRVLGVNADEMLRQPGCMVCGDLPPHGFTCNACGAS